MHIRKIVRPRRELWSLPALTGYFCEGFLSKTTRSRLILRKNEMTSYLTWNFIRLVCEELLSATARVALFLLKALAVRSGVTVRRSVVDREDLKRYWKSDERSHFKVEVIIDVIVELIILSLLFTSFSKTFLAAEGKLTGW